MQIQSFINIKQNPKANFYFGLGAINFLALGITFGFLNPGDIDTDGGTFAAIAYKDINGGTLYKDTWDHKPPGIYYLIEIFFSFIPHKIYALYSLSIIGILALVNGLYFTAYHLLKAPLLCILIIALFIFTGVNSYFMGDGLYTEIVGSALIVWSLYSYHVFCESNKVKHVFTAAVLSGFTFWFKEPFIFLTIPITIALALKLRQPKPIFKMLGYAAIPSMLFIVILSVNGSFAAFIEIVLYNFGHAGMESKITPADKFSALWSNILDPLFITLLIVLVYGFKCSMKKEARKPLIFILLLLSGALFFIYISPDNFNHYYLPFIVIFFYSLVYVVYYEKLYYKGLRIIIYALLLYNVRKIDDKGNRQFKTSFTPYQPDKITEILKSDKSGTLFIDLVPACEYYIKGEKIFPTYLAVPVHHNFKETEEGRKNVERVYQELKANKPDYLITNETTSFMYWHFPDNKFYANYYEKIDSVFKKGNRIILWRLKQKGRQQ